MLHHLQKYNTVPGLLSEKWNETGICRWELNELMGEKSKTLYDTSDSDGMIRQSSVFVFSNTQNNRNWY